MIRPSSGARFHPRNDDTLVFDRSWLGRVVRIVAEAARPAGAST
jgi:hypothetical protein